MSNIGYSNILGNFGQQLALKLTETDRNRNNWAETVRTDGNRQKQKETDKNRQKWNKKNKKNMKGQKQPSLT